MLGSSLSPIQDQRGRVAQSVARLTHEPEIPGSIPSPTTHTFISSSADSRRAVVSYWQKYVHEVLVNRLGGLRKVGKTLRNRLNEVQDLIKDISCKKGQHKRR